MTDKNKTIILLAAHYRQLCLRKDGYKTFPVEHKRNYDLKKYPEDVLLKAACLTDVYCAVDKGLINRSEAVKRQKEILYKEYSDFLVPASITVLTEHGLVPLEEI